MACGLRRCSGRRGCICPKARSPLAGAGIAMTSFPDHAPRSVSLEQGTDSKATPEDVTKLFKFFDMDGNGKIDRRELADVLSILDGAYWTMKRIRALFRAADLDRDQFISWQEFCTWVFAPGEEQHVVRSAVPVLEANKAAEQAAAEAEKAAIRELRSVHDASLAASETVPTLVAALASAEAALAPFFGMDELQEHRQRLERMQSPFEIVVMSLAGGEFPVEVTRQQSVASLCQELAKLFEKKAYRILLAHEGGRLEPPNATLEDCGVKGPMRIAAQFGEADPLLERSLSEFLVLLVEYKLATQKEIEALQEGVDNDKTTDEDIRCKFKTSLSEAIAAAEARRRHEEAERRRKAEEEEKQRRALEDRRIAVVVSHRSELELLPFDVLLAEAWKDQIVKEGEAVPEEHRDSLQQQLAFACAVKACEAAQVALVDQVRDDEADCGKLANEAQAIKDPAQAILDECLPTLDEAFKSLKKLKLQEILDVRCIKRPPDPLRKTLEAVCIIFQLRPVKKADPNNPSNKMDDYWEVAQKMLFSDPKNFMNDLFEYDKDNIPESFVRRVTNYIEDETCDVAKLQSYGKLCVALNLWTHGMYKYHFVAHKVEPYRRALWQKEAELQKAMSQLSGHREELQQAAGDLQYFLLKLASFQESKE